MKLRCLVLDDEPLAHDVIRQYAADISFLEIVGHCYRATEALEFLSQQPVDLLFLDIRLPKISGLELAKTLRQPPLIIVTSAHEEHALESFELEVCDYLLKPFRFERFLKAVTRALALHTLRQAPPAPAPLPEPSGGPTPTQLYLKADKKLVQVELAAVCYLESLGNYVKVWTNQQVWLTPRTLNSFEHQLSGEAFVRIHKSFIVNRSHVAYLEGRSLHLHNGKQVPIGKSYRHVVQQLMQP